MSDLDDLLRKNPEAAQELSDLQKELSELGDLSDISLQPKKYRLGHPFGGTRLVPVQRHKEPGQGDLITYRR